MKFLVLLILPLTVIAEMSSAQTVLVRNESADKAKFMHYLSEVPGAISYVEYVRLGIVNDSRREKSLFQLADQVNQPPLEILKQLDETVAHNPLSPTALQFLDDLLERVQVNAKTLQEKVSIKDSQCKVRMLTQGFANKKSCSVIKLETDALLRRFPFAEAVFLESREISLDNVFIVEKQKYNWTLASNVYQSIHFYGTFTDLLEQTFTPIPFVAGNCQSHKIQVDFTLEDRTQTFFSEDCIKSVSKSLPSSQSASWLSENRKWLIPTSLLLAGGIALSLKDKILIFEVPF